MKTRKTTLAVLVMAIPASLGLAFLLGCSGMDGTALGQDGDDDGGSADGDVDGDGDADSDGDMDADGDADGEAEGGDTPEPGQLTAGEWRDLDHWDFWTALFAPEDEALTDWSYQENHWEFHTGNRLPVAVYAGDAPVVDARVTLLLQQDADDAVVWSARTDNRGRAELFPGLFGDGTGDYLVEVEAGDQLVQQPVTEWDAADPLLFDIDAVEPDNGLDLMFVIDTTGSMSDELSYLQVELADVIERVEDDNDSDLGIRVSVNFYRDDGDAYTVLPFPFTTDADTALEQLADQSAAGGGDYEEAVELALNDAINYHSWSASARARLLFLVLDAPPHHTPQIVETLHEVTADAAEQGIRIIPLAASGVDKDTEFLLRFLDVSTGGTYTFLTNHSGIGGEHLDPTIGEYEVEYLNDLLVRVIDEAVAVE